MSDISHVDQLSADTRGTLALIDALRERGAIEMNVDDVYVKFAAPLNTAVPVAPAGAIDHEREAAIDAYNQLEGLMKRRG